MIETCSVVFICEDVTILYKEYKYQPKVSIGEKIRVLNKEYKIVDILKTFYPEDFTIIIYLIKNT